MTAVAPAGNRMPRLLLSVGSGGEARGLAEHEAVYGPAPSIVPSELLDEVERSGLCGRGGAQFSTATKLRAVAGRRGVSAVVVNGSETEPASRKDRLLMASVPHLVLDGALAAADAVGAKEVIIKVGAGNRKAMHAIGFAIGERGLGERVRVVTGPEGYVTGEESAVIQHLNGGPALPTFVPPRPFERGYRGRPTLVQNPETLAHLALIARYGADWFRQLGTEADPGTFLATVSGAVSRPGVYEVAYGTRVGDLITAVGGSSEPLQALLLGGYFGRWIPWGAASGLRLASQDLSAAGHSLGSGVLIALGESACGLHESARLARYLARQSAGQCGPCVHGLDTIAESFAALVDGVAHPSERQRIERWADEIDGRGACHHPNGAVRLIRSALQAFGGEIEAHGRVRCSARSARLPGLARETSVPPGARR